MRLLLLLLLLLLLVLVLLLNAGVLRTSGRWRRRVARGLRADWRGDGRSAIARRLRGVNLQRWFVLNHKRRSGMSTGSDSVHRTLSHTGSVVRMMATAAVVMASAHDTVAHDAVVTAVMVLTAGACASRRPLVAAVRIVEERVLVRLRIRV